MIRIAELPAWPVVTLSGGQLWRLAKAVRKFRRQIRDANLLFWSQRVLAELSQSHEEELCPQ